MFVTKNLNISFLVGCFVVIADFMKCFRHSVYHANIAGVSIIGFWFVKRLTLARRKGS